MADLITTETAANIWKALTKELRRPGAEGQRKMAAAAMAADTSTDRIESKAIIAKVISSAARESPWRRWSAIQRPSFIERSFGLERRANPLPFAGSLWNCPGHS